MRMAAFKAGLDEQDPTDWDDEEVQAAFKFTHDPQAEAMTVVDLLRKEEEEEEEENTEHEVVPST